MSKLQEHIFMQGERVELLTLPKQQIKSCLPSAYILTQVSPLKQNRKRKKMNACGHNLDITARI